MDQSLIGDMNTMGGGRDKPGGYTLAIGDTLGQYRIIRPLGRGGMGEVYEAEHVTLERRYALKLLPADFAAQPGALDRFRREARVMANLEHPHIVRVDDFGEANGRHWLRMEQANGLRTDDREVTSLQDLAEAGGGRVEQKSLAGILTQVLLALRYAHGRGAVHRDLKPSNILIFTDAEGSSFKIADFGLVRLVGEDWVRSQAQRSVQRSMSLNDGRFQTLGGAAADAEGTSTRSLLGTYEYMSPEQKRGEEATAQSDLYSVGLMAFKLLTGQNPGLKPPSRIDRSLDAAWDEVLERALDETAADRWPDAGTMLTALAEGPARGATKNAETKPRVAGHATARAPIPAALPPSIQSTKHEAGDTETVDLGGGVNLDLVWCPAGSFMMGSPATETDRRDDETQHRVTLSKGFWMGKHEVTQAQWEAVMGNNPSNFKNAGKNAPVEQVSWDDCQEFVRKVNARVPGGGFRLPTEAEWEYACRAGTTGALYTGPLTIRGLNNGPELDPVAWYGGNSGVDYAGGYDSSGWKEKQYDHKTAGTHPVGQKKPNAWNLYDMHGNVWEWCSDWYGAYPSGSVTDPAGPGSGSYRVIRGGSWFDNAWFCRSAFRLWHDPGLRDCALGLRLARTLSP